jgi:L-rhamnose-H+ transport protein
MGSTGWGFGSVLIAGLLNGSFVVPMKRMRAWRWENTWLVYSAVGLLFVPWVIAGGTIPHLDRLILNSPPRALSGVLLFGLGWGIGSVLFGLGVTRLGLGLGYGIILGIIATVGSILPLVALHPERIWTQQGHALFAGMLLVILGITFCAVAGRKREREASHEGAEANRSAFLTGLIICILAGVFSAMLNFAFAFGAQLQRQAVAAGVPATMAANGLWALTLTAGFLVNGGYCAYLLFRNHTWHLFSPGAGPPAYWLGASMMGVLCFASFIVYGIGAIVLGPLGAIVGWPLLMSMSLITANGWGFLTGEWKRASRSSYAYSMTGMAILIVAIVVISYGNR